ncbi:polyprenyl synthetase family protein [Kribbella sp. NPDC056861]|uniref:polyprenyl synthetase family protein n=1 Tax=Kribbella sp. NPDC056861 TaxID=3154857 RepID=UPI00341DB6B1
MDSWSSEVGQGISEVLAAACPPRSLTGRTVAEVLRRDSYGGREGNPRLFALAVLGCLRADPTPAVDISVLSHLWWAGAEVLDDLIDRKTAGHGSWSSGELLIGATACLDLLPQVVIDRSEVPAAIKDFWRKELVDGTLAAAEGQLSDLLPADGSVSWQQTMMSYLGKAGAAYGRDAAMAARLVTANPVQLRNWRDFGWLFGVLRQLRNDVLDSTGQLEDLTNSTPTLLLACAFETMSGSRRQGLRSLVADAAGCPADAVALRRLLTADDVITNYHSRVTSLGHRARSMLVRLASSGSSYPDALLWMIDEAVELAVPGPHRELEAVPA